jgi:hypothetical protein
VVQVVEGHRVGERGIRRRLRCRETYRERGTR